MVTVIIMSAVLVVDMSSHIVSAVLVVDVSRVMVALWHVVLFHDGGVDLHHSLQTEAVETEHLQRSKREYSLNTILINAYNK
jgi:hypothetical protein